MIVPKGYGLYAEQPDEGGEGASGHDQSQEYIPLTQQPSSQDDEGGTGKGRHNKKDKGGKNKEGGGRKRARGNSWADWPEHDEGDGGDGIGEPIDWRKDDGTLASKDSSSIGGSTGMPGRT